MWSLLFYLSLEKVWNYRLLSTAWYFAQPLLLRLVTMQVGGGAGVLVVCVGGVVRCLNRTWQPLWGGGDWRQFGWGEDVCRPPLPMCLPAWLIACLPGCLSACL